MTRQPWRTSAGCRIVPPWPANYRKEDHGVSWVDSRPGGPLPAHHPDSRGPGRGAAAAIGHRRSRTGRERFDSDRGRARLLSGAAVSGIGASGPSRACADAGIQYGRQCDRRNPGRHHLVSAAARARARRRSVVPPAQVVRRHDIGYGRHRRRGEGADAERDSASTGDWPALRDASGRTPATRAA